MAGGLVSERRDDGRVEAWINGWHIRFPADGGEPNVSKGAAPKTPPANPEDKITVSPFDSATFLAHGDWVVELRPSNFTVTPVQPEEDDGDGVYYDFME